VEPLVIYSDVVGLLRKKPEMYLGHDKATAPQLATMLAGDALALGEPEVRVRQMENDWTVVTARGNWTARGPGSNLPCSQLFRQLINLPEAGLNEARHEIYVLAYARDVFVATAQGIEVIQGTVPAQELRAALEADHFHIGFKM
jgi:hypothetical protein